MRGDLPGGGQTEPGGEIVVEQGRLGGGSEQGGGRMAIDLDGHERPVVEQLERRGRSGAGHQQRRRQGVPGRHSPSARAIKASVEGSKSSSPSPSSALAISLPSSTPNWSNGLMPSRAALAKVRCS